MFRNRSFAIALSALAIGGMMAGCAQEIGDIDRTQPDILDKDDFRTGEWYMRVTVSDVPATSDALFEGYTLDMEKVVFDITDGALMAYRSYEFIPGVSNEAGFDADGNTVPTDLFDDTYDTDRYADQVVAAFPITDHFDIQRSYNSSTGEQSNVISENRSDRPWYERDYMRVNWANTVAGSWYVLGNSFGFAQYESEGSPNGDVIRFERDEDGNLEYFDFVTNYTVSPSLYGCYGYLLGWGLGDCADQRVEIRTSFLRVPDQADYEPAAYDDAAMNKFGYFRTERLSYDDRDGVRQSSQIHLANRHPMFRDNFELDADGVIVRDEDLRPISRPFADRTLNPVVYHISSGFPQEIMDYAAGMASEWDRAFRRAAAAAQNNGDDSGWESMQPMFILCSNPIEEAPIYPADADEATRNRCLRDGAFQWGEEVLIGDLRANVAYWIDQPQMSGPLGYGPSAADPETGEIISGTAYVYGGSVDTYAQYATDLVRWVNGDFTDDDITSGAYVRDRILSSRDGRIDPRASAFQSNPALALQEIPADPIDLMPEGLAQQRVFELRADLADGEFDMIGRNPNADRIRLQRIADSGFDELLVDTEWVAGMGLNPNVEMDEDTFQSIRPSQFFLENTISSLRARPRSYTAGHRLHPHGTDNLDDSILGIAERLRGPRPTTRRCTRRSAV